MFLTVLSHFLLLLFELRKPFRQICYLIGVSGTRFLPGVLSGLEGLSRLVLLTTVFREPARLASIMGREWSINSHAPFAILIWSFFLTGSSFGIFAAVLLGHAWLIRFGGCSCPSLIGSGFVVVPFGNDFLDSFEILEHRVRWFRDCLVRQFLLVPVRLAIIAVGDHWSF